jgi:hypothetical protein
MAPRVRFARRTVQEIACWGDRLALVDKVSPHSPYDLMVCEISDPPKATPDAVDPRTGRVLWQTGLAFVRFVSDPAVVRRFGLDDGELHLALNCDPNTHDRESVQAAKQFHLHLLYWPGTLLEALDRPERYASVTAPGLRRQVVDPLAFLGAHLIQGALADLDLGVPGARWVAPDDALTLRGDRPFGALIALPGWNLLADPVFEGLVRRLHLRLDALAADLLEAFTGQRRPPAPWSRHALLPEAEIRSRVAALRVSPEARDGLGHLARLLRDLPVSLTGRLARASSSRRMSLMTLNQPCYALNLHAPVRNRLGAPLDRAAEVHLTLQPKLFSGIGGAGLLALGAVPRVRILRGVGQASVGDWRRRAAFLRAFAQSNMAQLAAEPGLAFTPVRRFAGPRAGWV